MSDVKLFYKRLTTPFPDEALSVDSSRGFNLTSVKAQYVVERMNETFGMDGWTFTGEYQKEDNGVLYFGELAVRVGGETVVFTSDDGTQAETYEPLWHTVEGVGYSDNKRNIGDTYKSARTDALSKAASMLGVANDVFKGKVAPPTVGSGKSYKSSAVKAKGPRLS